MVFPPDTGRSPSFSTGILDSVEPCICISLSLSLSLYIYIYIWVFRCLILIAWIGSTLVDAFKAYRSKQARKQASGRRTHSSFFECHRIHLKHTNHNTINYWGVSLVVWLLLSLLLWGHYILLCCFLFVCFSFVFFLFREGWLLVLFVK